MCRTIANKANTTPTPFCMLFVWRFVIAALNFTRYLRGEFRHLSCTSLIIMVLMSVQIFMLQACKCCSSIRVISLTLSRFFYLTLVSCPIPGSCVLKANKGQMFFLQLKTVLSLHFFLNIKTNKHVCDYYYCLAALITKWWFLICRKNCSKNEIKLSCVLPVL